MQFLDPQNVTDLEWEKFDKELAERFDLKSQFTWSHQEWVAYDRYLDSFRSSEGQIETAERRAELRKALAIAQQLLNLGKLSVSDIAVTTGLTAEQIEKLKSR
jgi:predicted amidophosphoribosyltransferase